MFTVGNNQFDYSGVTPLNTVTYSTQLTNITNSPPDDGFQVFGTDGSNGQDNYFVKAYFDGNSGCSEVLTNGMQSAGPSSIINPVITSGTGLVLGNCVSFSLISSPWPTPISVFCGATSIAGASNARGAVTELQTTNSIENEYGLKVYPNPSEGILYFESNSADKLSVINQLGQFVRVVNLNKDNQFKVEVRDLEKGIYFIKSQSGNQAKVYKIAVND